MYHRLSVQCGVGVVSVVVATGYKGPLTLPLAERIIDRTGWVFQRMLFF